MPAAVSPAVRKRFAAFEARGIFRKDGSYVHGYVALCSGVTAPYMYRRGIYPIDPDEYVTGWEVLREMWVRRRTSESRQSAGFRLCQQLHRVKVPALVLVGDQDTVSLRSARNLQPRYLERSCG